MNLFRFLAVWAALALVAYGLFRVLLIINQRWDKTERWDNEPKQDAP